MLVDMNHAAKLQDRFRGMMIGLALGDATVAEDGSIRAGVATELACYQLNSMLRSWRKEDSRADQTLIEETGADLLRWLWMRDSGEPVLEFELEDVVRVVKLLVVRSLAVTTADRRRHRHPAGHARAGHSRPSRHLR